MEFTNDRNVGLDAWKWEFSWLTVVFICIGGAVAGHGSKATPNRNNGMVYGCMIQVRTRVSIINASLYTETVKNRMVGYTLDNAIFKRIYMTETIVIIEYGSNIMKNFYYLNQIFLLFDIIQNIINHNCWNVACCCFVFVFVWFVSGHWIIIIEIIIYSSIWIILNQSLVVL